MDVPPRQAAVDGGYASRENLKGAKGLGVEDVAFHKKCGLTVEEMVKSHWVYRRLRNFRAGIEATISCLKRAYGLGPMHLERTLTLQGLRVVIGAGVQFGIVRTAAPDVASHRL